MRAGVDIVRIDGSFPSSSDDDEHIIYNHGFTGVSQIKRDGSGQRLLYKVELLSPSISTASQCHSMLTFGVAGVLSKGITQNQMDANRFTKPGVGS